MKYLCGISASGMFACVAAAGSPWPWSLVVTAAGAVFLAGLFASASRLGLFDEQGNEEGGLSTLQRSKNSTERSERSM